MIQLLQVHKMEYNLPIKQEVTGTHTPTQQEAVGHSSDASTAESEMSVFCFETDHVALKGNPDYQALLRTVALLESQRTQAIQDLDKLLQAKENALADPIGFVEKLQCKVDLGLPARQKIATIPHIQWEKYTSNIESYTWSHKHRTRFKKHRQDTDSHHSSRSTTPTSVTSVDPAMTFHGHTTDLHDRTRSDSPTEEVTSAMVRGKVKDESKSATFNRPWTEDEQRRLEELLLKYPTEEVEARRWEKIAKELGNRTKYQVQSRMQKYLIRLASEGLPLPGRMPNMGSLNRRRVHLHQRYNRMLYPQSTMSSTYRPPVYMSDDEEGYSYNEDLGSILNTQADSVHVSDEEDIPAELRDTDEYHEIMRLKRQCKQQQLLTQTHMQLHKHVGYSCDKCGCEPIVGTRWHCTDCPQHTSLDFCDNCSHYVFETEYHHQDHHLEPIRSLEKHHHIDTDYQPSQFVPGGYNYLDPNYMPAS